MRRFDFQSIWTIYYINPSIFYRPYSGALLLTSMFNTTNFASSIFCREFFIFNFPRFKLRLLCFITFCFQRSRIKTPSSIFDHVSSISELSKSKLNVQSSIFRDVHSIFNILIGQISFHECSLLRSIVDDSIFYLSCSFFDSSSSSRIEIFPFCVSWFILCLQPSILYISSFCVRSRIFRLLLPRFDDATLYIFALRPSVFDILLFIASDSRDIVSHLAGSIYFPGTHQLSFLRFALPWSNDRLPNIAPI